jgi:FKBP-type peptidyl-prolyl cis-trans isomerase
MKPLVLSGSRALVLAAFVSTPAFAQTALDTTEQKAGYSIGANIGFNLASQGLAQDLDLEALLAGVRDGVNGELKLTEEEIMAVLQEFSTAQQAKAQAAQDAMSQAGRDFLTENGTKDGVTTTASGLQYQTITAAADSAAAMPAATDTVQVHYHGTLVDGTVFDSSVDRGEPISFPLNGVIPGWTEGLQLMKVGDKMRFFIPPELGYGPNPVGPIPGNSVLIFDVELLAIEAPAADAAAQ